MFQNMFQTQKATGGNHHQRIKGLACSQLAPFLRYAQKNFASNAFVKILR